MRVVCDAEGAEDEYVRWNAPVTLLRVHSTGRILSIDLQDAITRMPACEKKTVFMHIGSVIEPPCFSTISNKGGGGSTRNSSDG